MPRPSLPSTLKFAAFATAALVVFLLPAFVSDFEAFRLALVAVYFIAILGLNVLTGYSGQISLGHGAFMAIGGYTTAILVAEHGVKDVWTIPLAGLIAGVVGFLFAIPALRLTGLYLSLATFGVAVALPSLIKRFPDFTGGSSGIQLFGLPDLTGAIAGVDVFGRHLSPNHWWYYEAWTIALVLFVVAWLLLRGRTGRAFRAVRDNEVAAASSGINLATTKTLAFGVSAFYAGVAGALYAIVNTFVNPQAFPVTRSLELVIGLVIAGLGSLWSVPLGALFIVYMPIVAEHYTKSPGVPSVVYGIALVLIVLASPGGLGGLVRRALAPLTSRFDQWSYSRRGRRGPPSLAKES